MKRYKFEVVITEGYDEFWHGLEGKTGCDDVLEMVRSCFDEQGLEPEIKLVEYTDTK